jgi:nitrite reductase/ring-hydroxylating ferredoxin subunit
VSLSRRAAIGSMAAAGTFALAACSAEAESTPVATSSQAITGEVLLGLVSEVPVGGGTKFPVDKTLTVLVTQTKAGNFKAFSATCTHAGCIVNGVENNEIACGCHGARFDPESGMAIAGPAKSALGKIVLEVRGEEIWITI